MTDARDRGGGSYRISESGDLEQVEKPTRDHPEGNRPRDSEGKPLDAPEPSADTHQPSPAPERPRGGPRRLSNVKE